MTVLTDPFEARLQPGERIVWRGAPAQGVRLRPIDGLLIPFSLMWGGFAIVWEAAAVGGAVLASKAGEGAGAFALLFPLWGVPFVLIGLFMIFGRFLVDAWLREKVSYALTDRRALIHRGRGGAAFQSVPLTDDVRLSRMASDGRGTVSFGPAASIFGYGRSFGFWIPAMGAEPEFFQIADASAVFDLAVRRAAAG